ncbi:MAG TPA: SDR family NAD(P)-dependent oxidoreductase [Solirubrobacteraceae bacterium]|jgi:short-subunit dehydrogenase|nr:SDR family NAD(P)-dependent oxidoreductase [Solirubrobacteraceae bacterium]
MQVFGANVLLTGATGGIGHAIARAIAARGGKLTLTGRRLDVLEPLAQELDARALAIDLAEPSEVARLAQEAGEVDVLIANAALPASGTLDSFTVEQIDRALDVNLRAPIVLSHALAPSMVARRRGHLAFMSSVSGKVPSGGASLYNASKFGLRGFAGALRDELHDSGVGVSAIFPGFISDAGMFAEAGDVKLPPGIGTRTPEQVADATIDAIERDRGEVDVAPMTLRASAIFAGLAPELAAGLARRLGSDEIARRLAAAQRDKR